VAAERGRKKSQPQSETLRVIFIQWKNLQWPCMAIYTPRGLLRWRYADINPIMNLPNISKKKKIYELP